MTDDANLPEHLGMPEVNPAMGDALGGLDIGSLLGAAQSMQAQMLEAQQRVAETIVEGQAGGGAVKISVSGAFEFERVTIDPAAIDADDPTMLEDLILAALHDATTRVATLNAEASPLSGLDLGGLGAMFGGS